MRSLIFALYICGCGNTQTSFMEYEEHSDVSSTDADGNRMLLGNSGGGEAAAVTVKGMGNYAKQIDEFNQNQKGVLDILLVIDNSGSMQDEQDELANNLPALLEYIKNSDWQIAVISTTKDQCLSARVTKHTPNFARRYKEMVNLGTGGSSSELYFYQAIQGLKGRCSNKNTTWLRDNSTVAVVIVGDEGSRCNGYGLQTCKSSDLSTHLSRIRPNGNAKVYGLLPSSSKWQVEVSTDPTVLSIFAAYGSIHDTSYADTLRKISQNVHNVLGNVFALSQEPSGVVNVVVNGQELTSAQYTIDIEGNKQLKFDKGYVPPEKATIAASYRYLVE